MRFQKILVANRAEIAVRVIAGARAMGYRTVAVFSEADRGAPHVCAADEAVCIGPAEVSASYLNIPSLLEAARKTGAQAVHPGYGFLAENPEFAGACEAAGLTFIGPKPETISLMGNKRAAKEFLAAKGVTCIPGYAGPDQDESRFLTEAEKIGYPLMVKAAAGGGGRGMRLVEREADLPAALAAARSEAEHGFGNGELILEKAIVGPRHVEIQIIADTFGNIHHLGERDCSVQRRYQKVVEEAPSPAVGAALRKSMGEAAVAVARAVDYRGAGTVEFLLDEVANFFFMEMNTRLQVEHGVTELVTGVDLVSLQLRVAAGEELEHMPGMPFSGHAIEVRLYAEDATAGFLPRTGRLLAWTAPDGEGIRCDGGLAAGVDISSHYDPMLAKILAWGSNREEARRRLLDALAGCFVAGVTTNRCFLRAVLDHPTFVAGKATTSFIWEHLAEFAPGQISHRCLALATAFFHERLAATAQPLSALRDWTNTLSVPIRYRLGRDEDVWDLELEVLGPERYLVSIDGSSFEIVALKEEGEILRYEMEGMGRAARFVFDGHERLYLDFEGEVSCLDDLTLVPSDKEKATGQGRLLAVMDGRIVAVHAATGDEVEAGQALVVMEAMKMELRIEADVTGTVKAVHVAEGDQVAARTLLVEVASSLMAQVANARTPNLLQRG